MRQPCLSLQYHVLITLTRHRAVILPQRSHIRIIPTFRVSWSSATMTSLVLPQHPGIMAAGTMVRMNTGNHQRSVCSLMPSTRETIGHGTRCSILHSILASTWTAIMMWNAIPRAVSGVCAGRESMPPTWAWKIWVIW